MGQVVVDQEFLEHYGVKGMRWGVRRTDAELARSKGGSSDSGEKKKAVVGKTKTSGKSASDLSDAHLKKVINRINMEQQYAKLTAPPPSTAKKVSKFFGDLAVNVARTQLTQVANQQASKNVATLLAGINNSSAKPRNTPRLPPDYWKNLPSFPPPNAADRVA